MAYISSKTFTFEEFLSQYGDNPRYELIDGELRDMEPTGPHEAVAEDYGVGIPACLAKTNPNRGILAVLTVVSAE